LAGIVLAALLAVSAAVVAMGTSTKPAGKVLWSGDGSRPLYRQWPSIADQDHCAEEASAGNLPDSRITLDTTGFGATSSRGRAIRLQFRAGDGGCYSGRTELATGDPTAAGKSRFPWTFNRGDEAWIALEAAWPEGSHPAGMIQFHEKDGPGVPPFGGGPQTSSRNGRKLGQFKFHLQKNSEPDGPFREFAVGPRRVAANTWYKFIFHAKFEEDSSGFLYIYLARGKDKPKLVYRNPACSLLKTGFAPTHLRIGNFLGVPARYESVSYIAGFTVATTQAAAEANAFH
jgi:polysaccharide lyase-like protein